VVAFVAIGRSSHGETDSGSGFLRTLWPFLGGLLLGWLLVRWRRRPLESVRAGGLVWAGILAGGVTLRAASGQGLAVSFVLVIAAFFAVVLLGWRALFALADRRLERVRS
jgi:hypothetical protein